MIHGNSQEVAAISANREVESVNGDKNNLPMHSQDTLSKCAGKASDGDRMLKEISNAKSEIEFELR
jgi:hypothetical protein